MRYKVVLILLFLSLSSFGQEAKYYDTPFGFGGGFLPVWMMPKFDGINSELKSFGSGEFSTSGMYASGGAGFAYIMVLPNLRVGGFGVSGSQKEASFFNGYKREVRYTSGFGGLTLEYTLPFVRTFGISIGTIIGGGNTTIELFRNNAQMKWDDLWKETSDPNTKSESIYKKIYSDYFVLAPMINIDIPFYRFFSFRIGAGYTFTFSPESSWKFDNNNDLLNVPSSINTDQLFIQTGIFFGFFSY